MSTIKAFVKRSHYRMWAGEITMVIRGDDGSLNPLTIRANALTTTETADRVVPRDLQKAQTALQQQVFQSMGEEYSKVKDVLACTVIFHMYLGYLSKEDLAIEHPQAKAPEMPVADNDPYAK